MSTADHFSHSKTGGIRCLSCGDTITKNYCPNCGEKKLGAKDFKLKHFLAESFEGFTHFDNKFFKTIKLLVTRPGMLSVDFAAGKRVPFMKPFSLFLVCNVLFYLLIGPFNIFSLTLYSFYNYQPFRHFHSKEMIDAAAPALTEFSLLAAKFNEKIGSESKAFLFLFIPALSLTGLLFYSKKRRFIYEHLVFHTHFFSFILLYYTVFSTFVTLPFYYFINKSDYNSTYDVSYSLLALAIFAVYYGIAAKRFYKSNIWLIIAGSVFFTLFYVFVLYTYRFLMFYKILHELA